MKDRKRILFLSNSQGTSAGLPEESIYLNYPSLIENQLLSTECRFWMMSDLSVSIINNLSREIIIQQKPDIIILQCGIIEAALRILPKKTREFLHVIPFGEKISKYIYDHRKQWFSFLTKANFRFVEIPLPEFEENLKSIIKICTKNGFQLFIIQIPLLSDQFEKDILIGNNLVISKYNDVIQKLCSEFKIPLIDPFENNSDNSRNSLFVSDSVHFSIIGHQLIADNIINYLQTSIIGLS